MLSKRFSKLIKTELNEAKSIFSNDDLKKPKAWNAFRPFLELYRYSGYLAS